MRTEGSLLPEAGFDLNLLRYMHVIVETSSVSRTADRINVTPPAVSAALKRLRTVFDDPILVRSGHVMSPTPRAVELAAQIRPFFHTLRDMRRPHDRFVPETARRTFTICGSDYTEVFVLPRLLHHLQQAAPGASVSHRPGTCWEANESMQRGDVDLGIGYLLNPPETLRARPLFSDTHVCMVREGHPMLHENWTTETYGALRHIVVSPGGRGRYDGHVDDVLRTMGLSRQVGATLSSFMAVPSAIAAGDFVATVPARIAQYFAKLLPIRILDLPFMLPPLEISMFWHERVHTDRSNLWLRSQVVELCAAQGSGTVGHSIALSSAEVSVP